MVSALAGNKIVRFAVQFDDQPRRVADEVGDEASHRNLAAEAYANVMCL